MEEKSQPSSLQQHKREVINTNFETKNRPKPTETNLGEIFRKTVEKAQSHTQTSTPCRYIINTTTSVQAKIKNYKNDE